MSWLLVTGCTGFVGRKLTGALLSKGHKVIGIGRDDMPGIKDANFKYLHVDITDWTAVKEVFAYHDITTVIHLAAIARSGLKADWNQYYRVNSLASKSIFECAARAGADIIFASTVDVYGAARAEVLHEDAPVNPVSLYGKSKFLAENMLHDIAREYNLRYVIPRLAPVYSREAMNDAYKRIYIKYPHLAFVIGRGLAYHLVSVDNVVEFVTAWVESDNKVTGVINIGDNKLVNAKEFIGLERASGNSHIVLRLPKVLFSFLEAGLRIFAGKNKLLHLSHNISKLTRPPEFCVDKLRGFIALEADLETTVYTGGKALAACKEEDANG